MTCGGSSTTSRSRRGEPASPSELARWGRRNPAVASLAAAVAFLLFGGHRWSLVQRRGLEACPDGSNPAPRRSRAARSITPSWPPRARAIRKHRDHRHAEGRVRQQGPLVVTRLPALHPLRRADEPDQGRLGFRHAVAHARLARGDRPRSPASPTCAASSGTTGARRTASAPSVNFRGLVRTNFRCHAFSPDGSLARDPR